MTQQPEVFQSSWSMELRPLDGFEWTLEEKFRKAAEVSCHGLSIDMVSGDYPTVEQANHCSVNSGSPTFRSHSQPPSKV